MALEWISKTHWEIIHFQLLFWFESNCMQCYNISVFSILLVITIHIL